MNTSLCQTSASRHPSAAASVLSYGKAPLLKVRRAEPAPKPALAQNIRVLLVDDHPVVRQGLASCLAKHNLQVVGEAANGRDALRRVKELSPDVVLMDLDMPYMSGLTATEMLRREHPGVKVLVLSMHTHSEYVLRILQCGARGYVLKDTPTEEMVKAIETIHGGGTFFSSDIARVALNQFVRGASDQPGVKPISNREREVLIAIAEGLSNKEIACRLSVGVRTVETHRERIMRKLNIHSVAGLTKYAIQKGLIVMPTAPETAFSQ